MSNKYKYGIFYKDGKTWRGPRLGELISDEMLMDSGIDKENASPEEHFEFYKRQVRRNIKRKIKICRMQVSWSELLNYKGDKY